MNSPGFSGPRTASVLIPSLLAGTSIVSAQASGAAQLAATTTSQPAAATAPSAAPPPFKLFRYEEDYSYLADAAQRTQPLDELKHIPLGDTDRAFLSLGGEARSRYEYSSAPAFGLRGPGHDDYLLQRFLLHADLHVGDRDELHGRAFVQLLSGLVAGDEFPKTGTQDNALDLQQAFVDIAWGDTRAPAVAQGQTSALVRIGRQEMGFGSYRLVTSRDPTNSRLSFSGVRGTLNANAMTFDAFLVRPTDPKIGLFNDGEDDNTTFWGLYSAVPLAEGKRLGVDFYYMGLQRDNARYESGIGDELRHSFGTRLWGRSQGWDHDTEAVLQVGSFDRASSSEDILAWTVASNTGYTFDKLAWKPRLGVKLNVASGDDDATDDRLGTFNPLFPRNNYFSDANLLAPYNFFDIHPTLTIRPSDSLTVTAGWDVFFRYSDDDAVFSPTGIVIPGSASDDRFVGSTLSVVADWAINHHITLTASYSHFFRGDVVTDAGGKDVDFFGIWLTAKF